jgi:hypothetical protein
MNKEIIKVGYDQLTNLYMIKPINHHPLEVNGKLLSDPIFGYRHDRVYIMSEKPETINYKLYKSITSSYTNTNTDVEISIEEYKSFVDKINLNRSYNDSTDEYVYNTIEDEIYATRFFKFHKANYEKIEETYELEIEIIDYPVSAYESIIPLYSLNSKDVFNTKCEYTTNHLKTLYEICNQYGIDRSRISVPSHSGLRYVKIDNNYLTGEDNLKYSNIIDTYEKCIERMNNDRKKIEDMVNLYLAKISQKTIDKSKLGYLVSKLEIIKNIVSGLETKTKSYNSHKSIIESINELIDTYKKLI